MYDEKLPLQEEFLYTCFGMVSAFCVGMVSALCVGAGGNVMKVGNSAFITS